MRLLDELAAEPDDLVLGPIAALIEVELRADHRKAHDAAGRRAGLRALLRSWSSGSTRWCADPPFTELAARPADKVLTKRVRKSFQRVKSLVERRARRRICGTATSGTTRSARRRSGCGTRPSRWRRPSVRRRRSWPRRPRHLQEVLGEHQDSVVARTALRQLGVRIHLDGDNAFTIGRLHALEQTRGDDAVRAVRRCLVGACRTRRCWRWLRQ